MRRFTLIPVALGAVSLIATALAPAANAVDPDTVVDGLVSPLSLAVGAGGTVYVSQNFASTLTATAPGEDKTDLYADAAHREVGAVSVSGTTVTFATTAQGGPQDARLWTLADGSSTPIRSAMIATTTSNSIMVKPRCAPGPRASRCICLFISRSPGPRIPCPRVQSL